MTGTNQVVKCAFCRLPFQDHNDAFGNANRFERETLRLFCLFPIHDTLNLCAYAGTKCGPFVIDFKHPEAVVRHIPPDTVVREAYVHFDCACFAPRAYVGEVDGETKWREVASEIKRSNPLRCWYTRCALRGLHIIIKAGR